MTAPYFYIDKTGFIKEWWESGDPVTLITRPRRFGKTLNMSMLKCFFSDKYKDREDLFAGLDISRDSEMMKKQGAYPVIFLSFAGVKGTTYEQIIKEIKKQIVGSGLILTILEGYAAARHFISAPVSQDNMQT